MAESSLYLSCTLILFTLSLVSSSNGDFLHSSNKSHRFRKPPSSSSPPISSGGPDIFFEVSKPVGGPSTPCSALILQHSFANTYSLPPAVANYTPPTHCGTKWDQIVLKWSGTCKGRQYDRIAAVWFGGVELLRTCTAEPTSRGIYWEVRKDVSRFSSVFKTPQVIALELANVVDSTYTGIFNINITLEFYKSRHRGAPSLAHGPGGGAGSLGLRPYDGALPSPFLPNDSTSGAPPSTFPPQGPADVVLPISNSEPLSQGYWFQISSENDTASVTFNPPANIYRAVLEVCVSFHGNDEFWYTNPPNDYLEANGLTGSPGNGPFREVQVFLDGALVGAVWPFPVIFTGGINPLYWRPAAAIGAYNLPSYDVELTPFVGSLVDGNNHTISMRVENADGSWPLDANLHLWLDPETSQTIGGLLSYDAPLAVYRQTSKFEGLDGMFYTTAKRSISFSGYIISSLGTILATASYSFAFDNVLVIQNDSTVEIVTQNTQTKGEVIAKTPSKVVFSQETSSVYPFYLYCADYSGANSIYTEECNLTHSFNQETSTISVSTNIFESVRNSQAAEGSMTVVGSTVTAGLGSLQQHYDYDSTQGCYDRLLSTKNYSTLLDVTDLSCELYKAQY